VAIGCGLWEDILVWPVKCINPEKQKKKKKYKNSGVVKLLNIQVRKWVWSFRCGSRAIGTQHFTGLAC